MNHKRQTRLAALERSPRTRHRSLTRAGGTDFSGPPTAASAMSVKKVPGSVRSFRETTTALSAVVTAGQAMTAKYQLLMASDAQRLAHDCLKQRVQDARSRFGPLARPRCRYAWLRVGARLLIPMVKLPGLSAEFAMRPTAANKFPTSAAPDGGSSLRTR